ncbi:MAG: ribulose-phosphate 3-epimerase [Oscillospiraceae bacterium]|nr:ribulose-phosphate 3-epimerase [Oscillospiraceae bacterium]
MIKIAPSLLSADLANLTSECQKAASADLLHFDVMDGSFVPNITFGIPVLSALRKCTTMPLDVHLMIDNPQNYIEPFARAGADCISVHLEAVGPTYIREALHAMEQNGVKKAIALRPITDPDSVLPYIEEVDLILVMTVEPGFGGQSFMDSQLPKIQKVRSLIDRYHPECDLEVDGGINAKTVQKAVAAGANVLVAGSAVFGQPDIPAKIAELRRLAEETPFPGAN